MNCAQARLLIGADPGACAAGAAGSGTALAEHLASCSECRRWCEEMRALDADIGRALALGPPLPAAAAAAAAVPMRRRAPAPAWRQWALAAGLAVAAFALLAVWVLRPADALAREVVRHVQGEPASWLATEHLTAPEIDAALRRAGVALDITSDHVVYAMSCFFRGHYVPHLVLDTANGPVTVLILRHEPAAATRSFRESGMSGVIVPAGEGSIAVLSRGNGDLAPVAAEVGQRVHWLTGEP